MPTPKTWSDRIWLQLRPLLAEAEALGLQGDELRKFLLRANPLRGSHVWPAKVWRREVARLCGVRRKAARPRPSSPGPLPGQRTFPGFDGGPPTPGRTKSTRSSATG